MHPYEIAKHELGISEYYGKKHNKRILEYHSTTQGHKRDEIPWCSSFLNWCFLQAGPEWEGQRSGSALARSWLKCGIEVATPQLGDVIIFGKPNSIFGHVGFFCEMNLFKTLVLGGNQNNQVNMSWYWNENPELKILGYRRFYEKRN